MWKALSEKDRKIAQEFFKKIKGIEYPVHDICVRCMLKHVIEKSLQFKINCVPLKQNFDTDLLEQTSHLESQKDIFWANAIGNKLFFAQYLCGLKDGLREAQKEMNLCTSNKKVLRLPRQTGKTISLGVEALHFALTYPGKRVLIIVPYENQINNIFEKMDEMISSGLLTEMVERTLSKRYYKNKPFEINFSNGSRISGYNVNQSKGTSVRGQSGNFLIIDEVDYIAKEAFSSVLPIMNANPDIHMVVGSTPKGTKEFFWKACHNPSYHEIHYAYPDMEVYSPQNDEAYKKDLTTDEYKREVLAEFSFQESGVFNPEFIDNALEEYEMDKDNISRPGIYTIGVDWNEGVAGVHIVIERYDQERGKIVTAKILEIPPSEFTQLRAVDQIISLIEVYHPKLILVDEGYGNTQIQMLREHGSKYRIPELMEGLRVLRYSEVMEQVDPFTREVTKFRLKPLMVSVSVRYLEQGKLILPASEDESIKLIGQMRKYRIESIGESNMPIYQKGNVHTLEAFMNAIYGMWEIIGDSFITNVHEAVKPIFKTTKPRTTGLVRFEKKSYRLGQRMGFRNGI